MLSDERLEEIEALADGATRGEWSSEAPMTRTGHEVFHLNTGKTIACLGSTPQDASNAAFICTMDPQAVLAMIAEIRSLRRIAEAAERVCLEHDWDMRAPGETERDLVDAISAAKGAVEAV